jgi:antitoxin component YwqK of YwqJK toxin-antitoxin module
MFRFIYFFSFLFVFAGCAPSDSPEDIRERLLKGEFDAYTLTERIHCDSIYIDSNDVHYINDTTLFTGVCFENYPNVDSKLKEKQIFQGKLHGHELLYSMRGDTISMNLYKNGRLIRKSIGKEEIVHCDSLTAGENLAGEDILLYFDEPYNGKCQKFYPAPDSNIVYIIIPYHEGKVDGEMIIYDKAGIPILKEFYVNGEKL